MGLRESKGNMYGFVTHTWNVFKGKCGYDCTYCYMKRFPQKPLRFDESELKTNLGEGNKIFVGSSTDMFHPDNSSEQIQRVLGYCSKFDNEYLFQTKNPSRLYGFKYPDNFQLCVTIESNINRKLSKAPNFSERTKDIMYLYDDYKRHKYFMITIEPIMKFDESFARELKATNPFQINIGADSGSNNLPEPSKEEVLQLISECEKFTKVVQKDNLRRLLK
ncbi:MAG: hypothetical protein GY853_09435 [PVC group bacterium]|nr:hypothetical protein [PVC group bacterium]